MNSHVNVSGIDKSYGDLQIMGGVSFHIAAGEFVSLVGPSGCGKSTVLEMIGGLKTPDAGSITIHGEEVNGPRASTGIIFQEAATLPWRNTLDNVTLSLEVRGASKADRQAAAKKAIASVGLQGFEKHYPAQLSGGMRQRVSLARVLTTSPELILADEPFGALDEQTRLIVALELLSAVAQTSASVLFVTHSIQEAVLLSDRVLVMSARPGQIIDEVVIDLPKTRNADLIGSPEVNKYSDRVWQSLRAEAQRSLEMQGRPS